MKLSIGTSVKLSARALASTVITLACFRMVCSQVSYFNVRWLEKYRFTQSSRSGKC